MTLKALRRGAAGQGRKSRFSFLKEGAFDTDPVSDRALELLAAGVPVQQATLQVHREFGGMTAGCTPAHRSSPLAMLGAIADEEMKSLAPVRWPRPASPIMTRWPARSPQRSTYCAGR